MGYPGVISASSGQQSLEVDVDTCVIAVRAKPVVLCISNVEGSQELGRIIQDEDRRFRIVPHAGSPLAGVDPGPYADRGAAMAAISGHLNGTCLHARPSAPTSPTAREA